MEGWRLAQFVDCPHVEDAREVQVWGTAPVVTQWPTATRQHATTKMQIKNEDWVCIALGILHY